MVVIMSEWPKNNFGGFERDQSLPTMEQIHEERWSRLQSKAATFGRGLKGAGNGGDVLDNRLKGHHALLAGAYQVIAKARNLAEGRNSGLTTRLREFIENPVDDKLDATVDQLSAYLLSDVVGSPSRHTFDAVDALIGLKYATDAVRQHLTARLSRGTDEEKAVRGATWEVVEDVLTTKFADTIPFSQYFDFDSRAQLNTLIEAAFGDPDCLGEPIKERLLTANEDRIWLFSIAASLREIRLGKDTQKINQAYIRFVGDLAKRTELGGIRTPELIIDGAALGMQWDLRMCHPASLLEGDMGALHDRVLCEFHVLQPLREGDAPRKQITTSHESGSKYYRLENQDTNVAFRLFRDGRIDFGSRLYAHPYRLIDKIVMDLGGRDALLYMKLVLASLVVDATAPTELYEKEQVESLPRIIGEALATGKNLGDVIRRKVIPPRAAILRGLQEERDRQGDGTGKQLNPHLIRGYAMQLRPGFKRSQKNLEKYLDHKAQGWVTLTEDEEEAIVNGEKCYIPPRMHGRRIGGPVVRAVLGDGTTAQIVQAAAESMEAPAPPEPTEAEQPREEEAMPRLRVDESKVATSSLLKRLLAKMKRYKKR